MLEWGFEGFGVGVGAAGVLVGGIDVGVGVLVYATVGVGVFVGGLPYASAGEARTMTTRHSPIKIKRREKIRFINYLSPIFCDAYHYIVISKYVKVTIVIYILRNVLNN
jgi:hypothetical protein